MYMFYTSMFVYVQYEFKYIHVCTVFVPIALCAVQANTKNLAGSVCPDLNLLKPSRIDFAEDPAPCSSLPDGPLAPPKWLEYVYMTAHPALCWLPTKLAECIGENLQDWLGFPDKADQGAEPGRGWTPSCQQSPLLTDHSGACHVQTAKTTD